MYRLCPLYFMKDINFEALHIKPEWFISESIVGIDSFTIQYENEEELRNHLKELCTLDKNLFITYNYSGIKATRPLYGSDESFKKYILEIADSDRGFRISPLTKYFKEDLSKLLKSSSNTRYMEYMHDNEFMNDYIYKLLTGYRDALAIGDNASIQKNINQLSDTLTNYKTLRTLYVGTRSYEYEYDVNKNRTGRQKEYQLTNEDIRNIRLNDDDIKKVVADNKEMALELKEAGYTKENLEDKYEYDWDYFNVYKDGGYEDLDAYVDTVPENLQRKINAYEKEGNHPERIR